MLVVFFSGAMLAYGESITASSGVPELNSLKKFYSIPKFAIGGEYEIGNEAAFEFGGKGGVTLESLGQEPLRVAYIDVGTPQKDENGKIINAVITSNGMPAYSQRRNSALRGARLNSLLVLPAWLNATRRTKVDRYGHAVLRSGWFSNLRGEV